MKQLLLTSAKTKLNCLVRLLLPPGEVKMGHQELQAAIVKCGVEYRNGRLLPPWTDTDNGKKALAAAGLRKEEVVRIEEPKTEPPKTENKVKPKKPEYRDEGGGCCVIS